MRQITKKNKKKCLNYSRKIRIDFGDADSTNKTFSEFFTDFSSFKIEKLKFRICIFTFPGVGQVTFRLHLQIVLEGGHLLAKRIGRVGIGFEKKRHLALVAVEAVASRVRTLRASAQRRGRRRSAVQQLEDPVLLHVNVGAAEIARQFQATLSKQIKFETIKFWKTFGGKIVYLNF